MAVRVVSELGRELTFDTVAEYLQYEREVTGTLRRSKAVIEITMLRRQFARFVFKAREYWQLTEGTKKDIDRFCEESFITDQKTIEFVKAMEGGYVSDDEPPTSDPSTPKEDT